MPATNASILETANAAITTGDNEGFLIHCTEDTKWDFVGDKILHGKEAVRQWMKTAYKEPPVFKVERLIEGGDFVTALGDITLKNEQGEKANYRYCDVWRFRDGKMAELNAFVIKVAD